VRSKSKQSNASRSKAKVVPSSRGLSLQLSKPSGTIWSKLEDYQQRAVEFILSKRQGLILYKQGTGKTWIALSVLENLATAYGPSLNAIVVVPLTNKQSTWAKTFAAQLPALPVTTDFDKWRTAGGVFLTHYEALPPLIDQLVKVPVTAVLYDESQRIKQRTSQNSKIAHRLAGIAEYRVAMTGTPIDQSPIELYSQFRFVQPMLLGTWKDFVNQWCLPIPAFDYQRYRSPQARAQAMRIHIIKYGRPQFDPRKLAAFTKTVNPWTVVQNDEVLGLDPMKTVVVDIPMSDEQQKLYDAMLKDFLVNIDGKSVTAAQRGVQLWKLHQIAGGFLIDEDKKVHRISRTKIEELVELLPKRQAVVAAKYVHEVEDIAHTIAGTGRCVGVIYGRTKRATRLEVQEKFQRGELDVVVLQIKTGGVGIDLYAANVIFFYSLTHSFIDFDQAKARIRRRGQTKPTTAYLMCSTKSIDLVLTTILSKKGKVTVDVITKLVKDLSS
jgi:SNF2 family DNA or RNA helicase